MRQHLLPTAFGILVYAQLVLGQPATVKRPIFDPALQRNAFFVNVPQNWQFDGAMVPGTTCETMPMVVYRASSPDGLTGVYVLPRFDWAWTTGPQPAQAGVQQGCMPFTDITAKKLLDYMLPILHVAFERDGDVSQEVAAARQHSQEMTAKSGLATWSSDGARYVVRYEIDHHPIEEALDAGITCKDESFPRLGKHSHQCSAFVTRRRAPQGQLTAQAPLLLAVRETVVPEWNQQWMILWAQAMRNAVDKLYGPQTAAMLKAGEMAGEARARQHQAFMDSMQKQGDARKEGATQHEKVRQHASDAFVDYVLDCTRLSNNVSVSGPKGICEDRQTAPYPQ